MSELLDLRTLHPYLGYNDDISQSIIHTSKIKFKCCVPNMVSHHSHNKLRDTVLLKLHIFKKKVDYTNFELRKWSSSRVEVIATRVEFFFNFAICGIYFYELFSAPVSLNILTLEIIELV